MRNWSHSTRNYQSVLAVTEQQTTVLWKLQTLHCSSSDHSILSLDTKMPYLLLQFFNFEMVLLNTISSIHQKVGKIAIQNILRKLQILFFLPSLYFISKCKDAIPSWPVLNFEMFVSSFTLCLLLILSSILFNTDHTVTFYQISIYFDTKVNYITRKSSLKKTWTQNIFHWPLKKETDSNMRKL